MLIGLRSRRQIAPFTLHRPETVADALALRTSHVSSAFMAGGMDLIDWLKYGHPIGHVIRLDGIPSLTGIADESGTLRIGATVTHDRVVRDETIMRILPDLATLWRQVANPRVRFAGTLGGNVMAGQAAYDGLPALLALGAEAEVATTKCLQRIALTAPSPEPTALLTAFLIPDAPAQRLLTDRSLRPALSVWLGLTLAGHTVTTIRVAIGGAHPSAVCATLHPNMPLTDLPHHAAILAEQAIAALPDPIADPNASGAYRHRMSVVLTRRLLIRAGAAA
jgi:carbon-monoxide dehydrogenase medium subunit